MVLESNDAYSINPISIQLGTTPNLYRQEDMVNTIIQLYRIITIQIWKLKASILNWIHYCKWQKGWFTKRWNDLYSPFNCELLVTIISTHKHKRDERVDKLLISITNGWAFQIGESFSCFVNVQLERDVGLDCRNNNRRLYTIIVSAFMEVCI